MSDPNNTNFAGAVVVSTSLLPPKPASPPPAGEVNPYPSPGQYIAISQVGGPTLWVNGTGIAKTAVWATRFSQLLSGGSHYKPGDLVSFVGTTKAGSFSQEIAIIVDAVGAGGAITQWHFLWGGLYDPTVTTDATFNQDPIAQHNHLQNNGTGAQLTPAWSGWSLLNNQTGFNGGAGYHVGDTITMSENSSQNGTMDGSTVNQSQYPTLVVETIGAGGVVGSFDWLDYGSYYALPTNAMLLTSVVTHTSSPAAGSGFQIAPVQWTRGPLATKIDWVQPDSNPNLTDIFVSENFASNANPSPNNAFPTTMPVEFFYYGDDDGAAIGGALNSQSAASNATGNGAAFHLPGACGTTLAISLPQDTTSNFVNPALTGDNFQSTGLYAFAAPLAGRNSATGITVLNRVLYGGLADTAGGGFRNMLIEAMGIPEGFGYYGLAEGSGPPGSTGAYVGPPVPAQGMVIPTAGDAVEIDSGKYLRIRNVHISDGGIGSGNAVFQCGIDESDPTMFLGGNAVGNIVVSDSRFDANPLFSGPTNSDMALRLGNSCHDSVYRALEVRDGTKADLLEYNGNLFSQIHLGSDAVNSTTLAAAGLVFITGQYANSGFAGVADYGAYVIGNASMAQTQCDIANHACVFISSNTSSSLYNPGQITDTQMQCGSLQSVPPNYYGVEVGIGSVDATIGGAEALGRCHVPPAQLVALDGAVVSSVSLCNNSNALEVFCGGYQDGFAPGRYYTQPALAYTGPPPAGVVLGGAASGPTTLYAIPFINPAGGPLSQLGLYVTTVGTATQCELGVYSSVAGAPGALLLDAGAVSAMAAGAQTVTGLDFFAAPNALYFLAVGCNGGVTVQGTTGTNGFAGLWLGEPDFVTYGATSMSATWSPGFMVEGLPATFGPVTPQTVASVPNVYAGP